MKFVVIRFVSLGLLLLACSFALAEHSWKRMTPPLMLGSLEVLEGDNQSAMVSRPFKAIKVKALSTSNQPLPDLEVNFEAPSTYPTASSTIFPFNHVYAVRTDANGVASVQWIAFGSSGRYKTTASTVLNGVGKYVVLNHINLPYVRNVNTFVPLEERPCRHAMLQPCF